MKRFLLFFVSIFCLLFELSAQNPFAERCAGVWEGTMHISNKGVVRDSLKVRLTVATTNDSTAWSWKTEYLSEKMPMTKSYVLRKRNDNDNIYLIDENNGILLKNYHFGNKLYGVFETNESDRPSGVFVRKRTAAELPSHQRQ